MIKGNLSDLVAKNYSDEYLQKGFSFLTSVDFSESTVGVHKDDEDLFYVLNEFETKDQDDCFWEAHRKYLDFHFILEGTERIAFDHINNQTVLKGYDEPTDCVIFEGAIHSEVTMRPGDVMVCYPEDSHMTGLSASKKEKVRKVVLKVRV